MITNPRKNLGKVLREQRLLIPLTLQQLSDITGVSISHLARIENAERFPSATVLQKIARPLGYEENEIFTLAGYLSTPTAVMNEKRAPYRGKNVDPDVIKALAQEPVEVQRAVIGLLKILKTMAANISNNNKKANN
jgi:transcriptional regulator with XRE-family HTH domain